MERGLQTTEWRGENKVNEKHDPQKPPYEYKIYFQASVANKETFEERKSDPEDWNNGKDSKGLKEIINRQVLQTIEK